jgi:hypothetical protein
MNLVAGDDSIFIAVVPFPQHIFRGSTLLLAEIFNDELPFDFPSHAQSLVFIEICHQHIGDPFVVELYEGTFDDG